MATMTRIFFTGATGYIGGSVLLRFLERLETDPIEITALVRSQEKVEKLRQLGVNAVFGSLEDAKLLERLASDADVVIDAADADNLPAARTILKGLQKKYDITGIAPIVIHTSGTGILCDNAAGMYADETIWDDSNPDQMKTLDPTQFHRIIDLEYLNADKQGYVKVHIVLPSIVYGIATGKLVEMEIQNPYSIMIPHLVSACLERGQGGMVGDGRNIWNNVHNDDMADFYLVLYDAAFDPDASHGREGIYFGENGEHTFYEASKEISRIMNQIGRSKTDKPTTFSQEEINTYFHGVPFYGANSRCRGNRSRSIGWKPSKTTWDFLASIEPEVRYLSTQSPLAVIKRYNAYFEAVIQRYVNLDQV